MLSSKTISILTIVGCLVLSLPLESVIKDNQQSYYQALEDADEQASSTPFIHFMLSVIVQTLAENAPVNAPANAPVNSLVSSPANIDGLKTPEAILLLVQQNSQLTRQQIADIIGKDVRTIGRAMSKLQQTGQLKRVGSDKAGHWEA